MIRPYLLASALLLVACGHQIGDSCTLSSDCSSDGTRICDLESRAGYCTIRGCDFGTCPSEAECVRFFPTIASIASCADGTACPDGDSCSGAGMCVPTGSVCNAQIECEADEFCTVAGQCAPLAIEQRYCMLSCSSQDDCREGYECRTLDLMKRHGGEPVTDPNAMSTAVPNAGFCAPLRSCSTNADCSAGEKCDFNLGVCVPQ